MMVNLEQRINIILFSLPEICERTLTRTSILMSLCLNIVFLWGRGAGDNNCGLSNYKHNEKYIQIRWEERKKEKNK